MPVGGGGIDRLCLLSQTHGRNGRVKLKTGDMIFQPQHDALAGVGSVVMRIGVGAVGQTDWGVSRNERQCHRSNG